MALANGPGGFVPKCKSNGGHKRTQCLAASGECWCVDKFGKEEQGTRSRGTNLVCDALGKSLSYVSCI